MSLLRDETFHANQTICFRQRLCFWAGFLYYITTAVTVLVTPVFLVLMFWLVPDWVYPRNSLYVCGGLVMWLIVNPLVMRGHWRISVLRVQMLYSYAHATAIWHIIRGRSQEWVATGAAATRSTPISVSVTRLMRVHVIAMQTAIVIGLVAAIAVEGFGRFWTVTLLAGLAAYVQLPAVFTPRATTESSDPAPIDAWPPRPPHAPPTSGAKHDRDADPARLGAAGRGTAARGVIAQAGVPRRHPRAARRGGAARRAATTRRCPVSPAGTSASTCSS